MAKRQKATNGKQRAVKGRHKGKPQFEYEAKTDNQRKYLEAIDKYKIIFGVGAAGTGKSFLAIAKALDGLFTKNNKGGFKQMILTRPAVEAGEHLGSLPGDIHDKIDPYVYPLYDNIAHFINKDELNALIEKDVIKILPLAYMRGVAQTLDSDLITPTGIIKMGDVKIGDLLIDAQGKPTSVMEIYPQGVKDIYEVRFNDNTVVRCCGDHLWSTQTRSEKQHHKGYTTKDTREILRTLNVGNNVCNHYAPVTKPVHFVEQTISIDPYVLGAFLGDGCSSSHLLKFTNKNIEIIDLIRDKLPTGLLLRHREGIDYQFSYGKYNPLGRTLDMCGLRNKKSYEKFIPDIYLYNSIDNRIALLRGLMDTDGCISKHRSGRDRIEFFTTSSQLANNMKFLVASLGGVATIRIRACTNRVSKIGSCVVQSKRDIYVVNILISINPFSCLEKNNKFHNNQKVQKFIKDIKQVSDQQCQCVVVDNAERLYLTNDCTVTHNTFRNAFVILDEAQNTKPSQMLCMLTRMDAESKVVITGDRKQTDIRGINGLEDALLRLQNIAQIKTVHFSTDDIQRDKLIKDIIIAYDRTDLQIEKK